jgi:DNA-binding GntR family transcriptional regulator
MPETDDAPLWRTIANQLRADIARETYPPASPLPGETALAQRYQTSRPTVRRALAELTTEGLITAAQGRGTFVRPRPDRLSILIGATTHRDLLANPTPGWTREPHPTTKEDRPTSTNHAPEPTVSPADRDLAEALSIRTGTRLYLRRETWRYGQTHRVLTITSAIPLHLLGPGLDPRELYQPPQLSHDPDDFDEPDDDPHDTDQDPDDYQNNQQYLDEMAEQATANEPSTGLYGQLATLGPIAYSTTATARLARGTETTLYGTDTATPILHIERLMTDHLGRALEITTIDAPADRFDIITTTGPNPHPAILSI